MSTLANQHCDITTGELRLRVRYAEVDAQGFVHHSRYAVFFEMGRTELLRDNGIDYKDLEENGILLVVARLSCRYHAPALYDDELVLTTTLAKLDRVRIEHAYELVRPRDGKRIATAQSTLVHVNREGVLQGTPPLLFPRSAGRA